MADTQTPSFDGTRDLSASRFTSGLSLFLFGAAVLAMVLFAAVKGVFKLSGPLLLYPYAIATLLFLATLPGFALSKRRDFGSLLTPLAVVAAAVMALIFYHLLILEEDAGDVLYIIRFYFGFFILFYGFVAFLYWIDVGTAPVLDWLRRLVAAVIVISFCMAFLEVVLQFIGLAGPDRFPWIQEATIEGLSKIESAGDSVPLRAFGIAANAAVLGGFSVFLTVYYFSTGTPARRGIVRTAVLLMGIGTIFLSGSGTGLLLLVLTLFVLFLKSPSAKGVLWKILLFLVILLIAGGVIMTQTGEEGRFRKEYMDMFFMVFGIVVDFLKDFIVQHPLGPVFGLMNLYQYTKPDAQQVLSWWGGSATGSYLRFYDFAYVAFLIELGLLGFLAYLVVFWKLVKRAFPKEDFAPRWAFLTLLIATIHYPVCFWVCCQVMAAVILAAHIYVRSRRSP